MLYSPMGLNHWDLYHCKPLELTRGRHVCNLVMAIGQYQVCTEWLLTPLPWVGGASCYPISSPPAISTIWWGTHLWGVWQRVIQSSPPSLHCGEGSSFPGLVQFGDMGEWICGGHWTLVILVWWLGIRLMSLLTPGLQSSLLFIPHIHPVFTGKVSSLTHFPLEPGCEDYSFLDQAVAYFDQGLGSILTDSIKTPELDTSLVEPDAITSSASSGFLFLVSTISDTSKLQLVPSIRSHKLWCQDRVLLAPVPLAIKMSASK